MEPTEKLTEVLPSQRTTRRQKKKKIFAVYRTSDSYPQLTLYFIE